MSDVWTGAIFSLAGFVGIALGVAVNWLMVKLGRAEWDDPMGTLGCAWAIACVSMILTGGLIGFAEMMK